MCITFCVKNGINDTKIFKIVLKAFCDQSLVRSDLFEWHKMFKECHTTVEDEYRYGRQPTLKTVENVKKIENKMMENRYLIVRELIENIDISEGSKDNFMWWFVCQKISIQNSFFKKKQGRVDVVKDMFVQGDNDKTFTEHIITGFSSFTC